MGEFFRGSLALLDCNDGSKKGDFAKSAFRAPWPAGPSKQPGLLAVQVNGAWYCVRAYAVETNKPVDVKAECGAVVAEKHPKSAATRGIGEECPK
jgi:hypothetical protein